MTTILRTEPGSHPENLAADEIGMDGHIRWLRRLLVSRVVRRLVIESVLTAVAVFCATYIAEIDAYLCAVLALSIAQLFAVSRMIIAVAANPVSHRYLMNWEDVSQRLQPIADDGSRDRTLDVLLDQSGFHHVVRLGVEGADDGLHVYEATGGRVAVTTGDDGEPFVVLSRLSDDRLLVTTSEVVPPFHGLIINQCSGASLPELATSHMRRLSALDAAGLPAVEVDHRTALEQLHLEWSAWSQLGPFIGPFLAVGRYQRPLTMQIRVDAKALWQRTTADVTWQPVDPTLDLSMSSLEESKRRSDGGSVAEPAKAASPSAGTWPAPSPAQDPPQVVAAPPAWTQQTRTRQQTITASISHGPPPMPPASARRAQRSLDTPASQSSTA